MLALEGAARGTTTEDIVARVLRNADDFSRAEAVIAGTAGKHRDAIAALATADEITAYDITAGWPLPGSRRADHGVARHRLKIARRGA
jgi:hypothetical protein